MRPSHESQLSLAVVIVILLHIIIVILMYVFFLLLFLIRYMSTSYINNRLSWSRLYIHYHVTHRPYAIGFHGPDCLHEHVIYRPYAIGFRDPDCICFNMPYCTSLPYAVSFHGPDCICINVLYIGNLCMLSPSGSLHLDWSQSTYARVNLRVYIVYVYT